MSAAPQLRGLLKSQLKRDFVIACAIATGATVAYGVGIKRRHEKAYEEFYKTYDAEKDFERMKAAGVFTSVLPDGSPGEGW